MSYEQEEPCPKPLAVADRFELASVGSRPRAFGAALARFVLPRGDQVVGESRDVAAGVVFGGSYLALVIGSIPGLSIDRAGIALVGAGLMVASGALPLQDAYKAVDL